MNHIIAITVCCALASCATDSGSLKTAEAERYRCENDMVFTVKFANDSATFNTNRGYEVLYRTVGGLTPTQTIFINRQMRAEFGLGTTGREALLRYPLQPLVVRCVRDLPAGTSK